MLQVFSPTQLLRKAGKQGLIAIQKQVTKKGKTFTQTFYVKPESVPTKPDPPKVVTVPEREMMYISRESGKYKFESNRQEGGFFLASKNDTAIRVPTGLIEKVIDFKGHTFVLHRAVHIGEDENMKWLGSFRVSELSTGVSVSSLKDTAQEAEDSFRDLIGSKTQEDLSNVIEKTIKVANMTNVIVATDNFPVNDVKRKLTEWDFTEAARNVWINHFQGTGAKMDMIQINKIKKWMDETEGITFNDDLQKFFETDMTTESLSHAIKYELPYNDAENSIVAIHEISEELANIAPETIAEITEWAHNHEDDLTDGFNEYEWNISDSNGNEMHDPADIIYYAMENNMSLREAKYELQQVVDANEEPDEPAFDKINITDSYGYDWDYGDISPISSWVGGVVETTRHAMKARDETHRKGIDIEGKLEQLRADNGSLIDNIIDSVERHMAPYNETILYRGTRNDSWLNAEEGQIIPFGMASFSKSDVKAHDFSHGKTVIIFDTSNPDDKVTGVDVHGLTQDIRDAGYSSGMSAQTNLEAYDDEKEVIIRSPSIEIIKIVDNTMLEESGQEQQRIIYARPAEMNLVQFMKSLFEDDIAEMERTFDYPLHREPEDAWN